MMQLHLFGGEPMLVPAARWTLATWQRWMRGEYTLAERKAGECLGRDVSAAK